MPINLRLVAKFRENRYRDGEERVFGKKWTRNTMVAVCYTEGDRNKFSAGVNRGRLMMKYRLLCQHSSTQLQTCPRRRPLSKRFKQVRTRNPCYRKQNRAMQNLSVFADVNCQILLKVMYL